MGGRRQGDDTVMAPETEIHAELLIDSKSILGEGPLWVPATGLLHWVDITGCLLHQWAPATGEHKIHAFDAAVCAVAAMPDDRLMVAFAKRLALFDPTTQSINAICDVEPDITNNRCNDGKMDPAGRFWIGTMDQNARAGVGSLYRLDGECLTRVLGGVTISNGMGWSNDARTMYFIDSPTREVSAFDFDASSSAISNRRVVVRTPELFGVPDGMAVGNDGTLWVAFWGSGRVCQWDPSSGALLCTITTECPFTTSCCFGSDGDLFITTAKTGLDAEALAKAPHSGSLFRVRSGDLPRSQRRLS